MDSHHATYSCPHSGLKEERVPFLALHNEAFLQSKRIWILSSKFSLVLCPGISSHSFYSVIRVTFNESNGSLKRIFPKGKRLFRYKTSPCRSIYVPDAICFAPHNLHTPHLTTGTQLCYNPFTPTPAGTTCTNYREGTSKCRIYHLLSPD